MIRFSDFTPKVKRLINAFTCIVREEKEMLGGN